MISLLPHALPPMPTHEEDARFLRELARLSPDQRIRFNVAIPKLVGGLVSGSMPASLRVKRVQNTVADFEMTWAPDGRAIFRYGDEAHAGDPHIIWLRIGTHDIFD